MAKARASRFLENLIAALVGSLLGSTRGAVIGFGQLGSVICVELGPSLPVGHAIFPLGTGLAEHEPHRRNDFGDHGPNRDGNYRLTANAPAQPSRGLVARGSFWTREIRWHSATIAGRVLPVSVPTSAFRRIPIALHAS
jgi:hypothetical protein